MIKIIDDDGRGIEGAAESVVVDGVFQPFPPCKGAHRCVQRPPIGAAAAKRIFSITHQMVAKGLKCETPSPCNCFALHTGMMTYGALLSMENCRGMA